MSLVAWIVLGLVSGSIASLIVNRSGEWFLLDVVVSIVGAVAGSQLLHRLGMTGVTGFNLYSLLVAVAGAVPLLVAYHAVAGRRARFP